MASAVRRCSEFDMDSPLEIERAVASMDRHDEITSAEADYETCVCT